MRKDPPPKVPEEARYCIGYPDQYSVTRDGRVYSHKSGMWMKIRPHLQGYRIVNFYFAGVVFSHFVHNLVMDSWGPPKPSPESVVMHGEAGREVDGVDNLSWGSQSKNIQDGYRPLQKLSSQDIRDIKRRYSEGELQKDIAILYDIGQPMVSLIVTGKSWSHVSHSTQEGVTSDG